MKNYCRCIFTLVLIIGSQVILHGGTIELSEEVLNVLREVAVSEDLSHYYTNHCITDPTETGEIGKLFLETYKDLWSKKGKKWEPKKDFLSRAKEIQYCYRELDNFFEYLLNNMINASKEWETGDECFLGSVRADVAYCAWFLSVYKIDLKDAFFTKGMLYGCLRSLFLDLGRKDWVAELDVVTDAKF